MARKQPKFLEKNLWGEFIEEPEPQPSNGIIPLDFEGHGIRIRIINGVTYGCLSDIARTVELGNAPQIATRLDDDEKTTITNNDSGGRAHKLIFVNQFGLYRLLATARTKKDGKDKDVLKRFQRWLFHEVIPSIINTGSYCVDQRIPRTQKRNRCDLPTAKVRVKQIDWNKAKKVQVADDGGSPRDMMAIHIANMKGGLDKTPKELREMLGQKDGETPLDKMELLPLSNNLHSKILTDRLIVELKKTGHDVPLEDQPGLYEATAREVAQAARAKFGPDYHYGIIDHPKRGPIIDITKALPSPC